MAKNNNKTTNTQYVPLRLEHEMVSFADKFPIYKKDNLSDKVKSSISCFQALLTITRKELSLIFSKEEFMYFISVFEDSLAKDIATATNYKNLLINTIQESFLQSSIDSNFDIKSRDVLKKIEQLTEFSSFALMYSVLDYIKNYSEMDIDNVYLSNYFSPV